MSDPHLGSRTRSGAFRYDAKIELDSPSVHAKIVELVGSGKRVLELGCATGYMSKVLRDLGCQVVAVEIDAAAAAEAGAFCERVIVGDLDVLDLPAALADDSFDVVVAADVLEHLKEPQPLLRDLKRVLRPDGYVVASVPNVAHASVRLALLGGSFRYDETGLLDRTHLRFFTYDTVQELFEGTGYAIGHVERRQKPLEESEVTYDRSAASQELVESLGRDPEALTYHFIIVAHPLPRAGLARIQRRVRELAEANDAARQELEELRRAAVERDLLAHRNHALELQLANLRRIGEARAALGRRIREVNDKRKAAVAELAALQQVARERDDLARRLRDVEEERDSSAGEVERLRSAAAAEQAELTSRAEEQRAAAQQQLASVRQALSDEVARRMELVAAVKRLEVEATELRAKDQEALEVPAAVDAPPPADYVHLVHRIRGAVAASLPADAVVLVASKEVEALEDLGGRTAWHFARSADAAAPGPDPSSDAEAIAQLEELRAAGAQYFLLPSPSLWWLDRYAGLREHLESRYPVVVRDAGQCLIYDLRDPLGAKRDYFEGVARVAGLAQAVVPPGAVVAVASKGDDVLLKSIGRTAWHFPRDAAGAYTGYYPADDAAAVAQLEAVRRQGAEFLLFPAWSFWWLLHYSRLREHLERRYRVAAQVDDTCAIFDLREPRRRGILARLRRWA